MRELVKDKSRLEHILGGIDDAFGFTQNVTPEDIERDKMLRYAIVHSVQIVGEAAYKLSKEFCETHPEVIWKDIIGLRHVLVHDYYNVRALEVWNIVKQDFPLLREQITKYLIDMA